jgi:hypothetical protein
MKAKPFIYILLGVLAAVYSIGIFWGMPSEFSPEIDADVPFGVLSYFSGIHDVHRAVKYPAFHKIMLLPFYGAYFLYAKITGNFSHLSSTWPFGFKNPVVATTALIVMTRIVNLIMGIGTLWCLFILLLKESKSIFDSSACLLLFGLSGAFTYYVKATNYDGPQLLWWSLSLLFLWNYLFNKNQSAKNLWLSGIFIGIATATKDQNFVFALSSGLTILFFGPENPTRSKVKDAALYGAVAFAVYALAAIACNPALWVWHVKYLLSSGGIYDFTKFAEFSNTLSGQVGLLCRFIKILSGLCSLPGCMLAGISLIYLARAKNFKKLFAIVLPLICFYFIVVYRNRFVHERYALNAGFLLMVPACSGVFFCTGALQRRLPRAKTFVMITALTLCIVCQLVFGFIPVTYAQAFDVKKRLAIELPGVVPKGSVIEWQGSILELPNSDSYMAYNLVIPKVVKKYYPTKRIDHVFSGKNGLARYILSSHDLFNTDSNQRLIDKWRPDDWVDKMNLEPLCCIRNPQWVEDNIRVYQSAQTARTFVLTPRFYVYKRVEHEGVLPPLKN